MLLDELQRAFEYLPSPGLLHRVGVPWVPEQGQQVIRRARAADVLGEGRKNTGEPCQQLPHPQARDQLFYSYWCPQDAPYLAYPKWEARKQKQNTDKNQKTLETENQRPCFNEAAENRPETCNGCR